MSQAAIDQPQSTSSGLFSNHPPAKRRFMALGLQQSELDVENLQDKSSNWGPRTTIFNGKTTILSRKKKHVTPNWKPWFLTFKISYIEIIFSDGFPRVLDGTSHPLIGKTSIQVAAALMAALKATTSICCRCCRKSCKKCSAMVQSASKLVPWNGGVVAEGTHGWRSNQHGI